MEYKQLGKKLFSALRILGIGIFIYILFSFDLSEITNVIKNVNVGLLLFGIVFQLIVLVTKGIRWHFMNNGRPERKYWESSLGRFFESYAIGVVTPARVGEVMKLGYEKGKKSIINAAIRIFAERGIDVGLFCTLAGLSIISGKYIQMNPIYAIIIPVIGMTVTFAAIALLSYPGNMIRFINKVLKKLGIRIVFDSPDTQSKLRVMFYIVFLSFISNFSYFISCYFLGKSVGIDAGFIWVTGAVVISGLLNMLPVTIMGLGTSQLVFLYVFKNYAAESAILAFSFLVILVAQIGGGLVSLIMGQGLLLHSRKFNYE